MAILFLPLLMFPFQFIQYEYTSVNKYRMKHFMSKSWLCQKQFVAFGFTEVRKQNGWACSESYLSEGFVLYPIEDLWLVSFLLPVTRISSIAILYFHGEIWWKALGVGLGIVQYPRAI